VKSNSCDQHIKDLEKFFEALIRTNMRLNPEKCTFGVEGGKFLSFILTHRGIEANLDKCQTITEMRSPKNIKEVQQLIWRLTVLFRFVSGLANRTRPMMQLLRKATKFKWDEKCEEIFQQLKDFLLSSAIIQ